MTFVLYSQDADAEVAVLAVSDSAQNLQDHAAELELKMIGDTGETIEWELYDGDIARAEFNGLDYWITPVQKV